MNDSAPNGEPLRLTFHEALWELCPKGFELHGSPCAYGGIEWSIRNRRGSIVHRDAATWPEAVSAALGRPVVERDPAAELVEVLELIERQDYLLRERAVTANDLDELVIALANAAEFARAALAAYEASKK